MQLPIFRITSRATSQAQGHHKERIFVITSGSEIPLLPLPEQIAKTWSRDVWAGLSPNLEDTDSLVEG